MSSSILFLSLGRFPSSLLSNTLISQCHALVCGQSIYFLRLIFAINVVVYHANFTTQKHKLQLTSNKNDLSVQLILETIKIHPQRGAVTKHTVKIIM